MSRLEQLAGTGGLGPWIAAEHRNTAHAHVHIVMAARREVAPGRYRELRITPQRLAEMKTAVSQEIERQRGVRLAEHEHVLEMLSPAARRGRCGTDGREGAASDAAEVTPELQVLGQQHAMRRSAPEVLDVIAVAAPADGARQSVRGRSRRKGDDAALTASPACTGRGPRGSIGTIAAAGTLCGLYSRAAAREMEERRRRQLREEQEVAR
jgi:hypothetical protein